MISALGSGSSLTEPGASLSRGIPVLVVTAKDLTDADRIRLNGGVERIIQKTNRDDMLREVRSVLAKFVERPRGAMRVEA